MIDFGEKYRSTLAACPAAGTGVHAWVMQVANYAFFAGIPADTAEVEIVAAMSRPQQPRNEVSAALRKAAADHPTWVPPKNYKAVAGTLPPAAPKQEAEPEVEMLPDVAARMIADAPGGVAADAWMAASPEPVLGVEGADAALMVLCNLYHADEMLFAGERWGKEVRSRAELEARLMAGGSVGPYVIPNPVDGEEHDTRDGKRSRRCDDAVERYPYVVAEMDEMPLADQIRFWWTWDRDPELGRVLPIAALTYSGKKSVHAWIRVDATDADEWKREIYNRLFPKVLIPLGCDRTCRNASRLSRMAGWVRDGVPQSLYYLAPAAARPSNMSLAEAVRRAVAWVRRLKATVAPPPPPDAPGEAQEAAGGGKEGGEGDGKKKKGRPPIALTICNSFFTLLGDPPTLRWHREGWYIHRLGRYRAITDATAFGMVMGYLHRAWPNNASPNMASTILAHLKADDMCQVPQDYQMPCWLPDGQPALGLRAFGNVLVDLEAAARGEVCTRPFDARCFSVLGSDFDYDPTATCPRWMQFLDEVQPTPEGKKMLQMMFGLMLVPDTSHDVFFILYGDGGTGKTVTVEVLEMILGEDNVAHLDVPDLNEKHGQHVLAETLANIGSEIPARLASLDLSNAEAQIKRVASGEKVKCERKGKDPYFAEPRARLIFCTNTLPMFSDVSGGLWRRVRLIPFEVKQVDKPTTDLRLVDKLREELPGIVNWAIAGLGILRGEYRVFPQLGRGGEIIRDHRAACDKERIFLEEAVEVKAGASIVAPDLYKAYKRWCDANGYKAKGANLFTQDVRRVYPGAVYRRERADDGRQYRWINLAETYILTDDGDPAWSLS